MTVNQKVDMFVNQRARTTSHRSYGAIGGFAIDWWNSLFKMRKMAIGIIALMVLAMAFMAIVGAEDVDRMGTVMGTIWRKAEGLMHDKKSGSIILIYTLILKKGNWKFLPNK